VPRDALRERIDVDTHWIYATPCRAPVPRAIAVYSLDRIADLLSNQWKQVERILRRETYYTTQTHWTPEWKPWKPPWERLVGSVPTFELPMQVVYGDSMRA
jgi:hypothetical protein